MLRKICFSTLAFSILFCLGTGNNPKDSITKEEPEAGGLKISGYVDAYYRFNFITQARNRVYITTQPALPTPTIPLNWAWPR
jgi:hypothetical protein